MKEEDINIKKEIITDQLNYNNLMEFQTDINRNIELDGALVIQSTNESVDITPRCSLGYSDLKGSSDKRMLSNNFANAFRKMMEKQFLESNGLL